jgi:hypothetical protein
MSVSATKYNALKNLFVDVLDAAGFLETHDQDWSKCRDVLKAEGTVYFANLKAKSNAFDEISIFAKEEETAAVDIEAVKTKAIRLLEIEEDGVQKANSDAFDKLAEQEEVTRMKPATTKDVKLALKRLRAIMDKDQVQNLGRIVQATVRFFVARQALWTQMASRLAQARDRLGRAHTLIQQEDIKGELVTDMQYMDELVSMLPLHDNSDDFGRLYDGHKDSNR